MWTQCVPRTCGLLQQSCLLCTRYRYSSSFFAVIGHIPTVNPHIRLELIILSRMRKRDTARSFDSGVRSSIRDSVRLVSMPTTRSGIHITLW